MHLPIARTVPSPLNVHCCAAVPLQSHICRRAPSTGFAAGMSMHLPLRFDLMPLPPAGGGVVPPSVQLFTRT